MSKQKQTREFPIYLAQIRRDLILQISKLGLSMQNIADIFSVGITKGGVHQIVQKVNKDEVKEIKN